MSYIDNYTATIGGGIGAAVAGHFAHLSPEATASATVAGTLLMFSFSKELVADRIENGKGHFFPPLLEIDYPGHLRITTRDARYLQQQLRLDFRNSAFLSKDSYRDALDITANGRRHQNPRTRQLAADLDAAFPFGDTLQRRADIRAISDALKQLRSTSHPIRVSCLAPQTAIIATLIYMESVLRIPLEICDAGTSGADQITTITKSRETTSGIDYVFISNPDILMVGLNSTEYRPLDHDFRFLMPIHRKKQYVVRTRSALARYNGFQGIDRMRYVELGCAHEHYNYVTYLQTEGRRFHRAKIAPDQWSAGDHNLLSKDLDDNEAILLWEHGVPPLKARGCFGTAEGFGTQYEFCVSLFARRDVGEFRHPAFQLIFANAWRVCADNLWMSHAFLNNSRFRDAYRATTYFPDDL